MESPTVCVCIYIEFVTILSVTVCVYVNRIRDNTVTHCMSLYI